MKINKCFEVFPPDDPHVKSIFEGLRINKELEVPKKAIGFVKCETFLKNTFIETYSFCFHSDEWDENVGRKLASERLYDVIGKLNIQNVREKVLGGKLQVCPNEFAEKIIELDNNEGQL